jgi:hypothetical protein
VLTVTDLFCGADGSGLGATGAARRREIEQQQRTDQAHAAQITRWHHDDLHARNLDRSSGAADGGAIVDRGAAR